VATRMGRSATAVLACLMLFVVGIGPAHADYEGATQTCELFEDAYAQGRGAGSMSLKAPGASTWWTAPYDLNFRSHSVTVYKDGGHWAVDASTLDYTRTFGYCV